MGRLGNQMFILAAALKERKEGELVLLVGFPQLWPMIPSAVRIKYKLFQVRPSSIVGKLYDPLHKLSLFRVTGRVSQRALYSPLERTRGFIPVRMLSEGFYQEEQLVVGEALDDILQELRIKHANFIHAIKTASTTPEIQKTCFIHVRRGDYLSWPSQEFPAALPVSWFRAQIDYVRSNLGDVRFLLFSDDPEYCREQFTIDDQISVIDTDEQKAWLAMACCDAGILSPSTLSWWSAKLSSVHHYGPYIAPKYWFSWKRRTWKDTPLKDSTFITWR